MNLLRNLFGKEQPAATPLDDRSFEKYQIIHAALESKDYKRAEQTINDLVKQFPDDAELWRLNGICSQYQNNYSKAENCFKRALSINKKYPKAWITLAKFFEERNQEKEALNCYEAAVNENPQSAHLFMEMGAFFHFNAAAITMIRLGSDEKTKPLPGETKSHFKKALDCFEKAYKLNKQLNNEEKLKLLMILGSVYLELGQMKDAQKCLNDGLKIDPASWQMSTLELGIRSKK